MYFTFQHLFNASLKPKVMTYTEQNKTQSHSLVMFHYVAISILNY